MLLLCAVRKIHIPAVFLAWHRPHMSTEPLEARDLRKLINVAQFNGSSGLDVAIGVATATVMS